MKITRAHYLTVINSFYNYLVSENIIKINSNDLEYKDLL